MVGLVETMMNLHKDLPAPHVLASGFGH